MNHETALKYGRLKQQSLHNLMQQLAESARNGTLRVLTKPTPKDSVPREV